MRNILGIIGKEEPGRLLVRDFLTQNWNHLFLHKKRIRGELLESLTFSSNTKAELEIVERFLSRGGVDLAGNRRKIHQVLEQIRNNIAWTDANCDVIAQLLEEMGYSGKSNARKNMPG
ncbi:leucyl-cystinyl aminopeptidase-like [Penaeus chinensis]|uniref:leucyl-cystinyl aminopeptidase-like n=1 Tax=Penaeus chinensis TaxID=139456 RepID=UPI001FB7D12E|nr:leucyl-cystinyl aminopeptidase-like [Penaeus chinensis]